MKAATHSSYCPMPARSRRLRTLTQALQQGLIVWCNPWISHIAAEHVTARSFIFISSLAI